MPGRLIIVCGLPGAGKTTHATQLAADLGGVRFCPDEWMEKLGFDLYDQEARGRVESLQAEVARELLGVGQVAIIEWGTWVRAEREQLRSAARSVGAAVELHFLDESADVLWQRIQERDREQPPITRAMLDDWITWFERPSAEELALYDNP